MKWRYYCDFCKKSAGASLVKHERHCGMNPNRECRMCPLIEEVQQPISDLMDALDAGGLPALRDLAADCPGCIVAAIRQRRKRKGAAYSYDRDDVEYDFKAETEKFFERVNEEDRQWKAYA